MDCVVSIPSFSVRNDGRPNEGPATDSTTCHTEDEAPVTRIRLTPTPHLAGALHPHHHPAAVAVAAPARGPARGQLAVPERAACVAAAGSVQQTVPPGVYVCMFSRRCNVCKYFFIPGNLLFSSFLQLRPPAKDACPKGHVVFRLFAPQKLQNIIFSQSPRHWFRGEVGMGGPSSPSATDRGGHDRHRCGCRSAPEAPNAGGASTIPRLSAITH